MRNGFRGAIGASVVAAVVNAFWVYAPPAVGQTSDYTAPRGADGHPDLNGIWQALNTANYDLEAHPARPALALIPAAPRASRPGLGRATRVELAAPAIRAFGAVGGVPAGGGCRCRQRDSVSTLGGGQETRERRALARARSGDQVLHAGCAARDVHAVPVPDPSRCRQILIAYEYAGATRTIHMMKLAIAEFNLDGLVAWTLGRRHARDRRDRF